MSRKAERESKQPQPFECGALEAYVNVLRTADWLLRDTEKLLSGEGLTPPQYNVLRILRGARRGATQGAERGPGLPCREIGARMITRDPDITRLLDRLEKRGLITRTRDQYDRRVITVRISAEGLRILSRLDQPVTALHARQMKLLGRSGARQLVVLLEKLRQECSSEL